MRISLRLFNTLGVTGAHSHPPQWGAVSLMDESVSTIFMTTLSTSSPTTSLGPLHQQLLLPQSVLPDIFFVGWGALFFQNFCSSCVSRVTCERIHSSMRYIVGFMRIYNVSRDCVIGRLHEFGTCRNAKGDLAHGKSSISCGRASVHALLECQTRRIG